MRVAVFLTSISVMLDLIACRKSISLHQVIITSRGLYGNSAHSQ